MSLLEFGEFEWMGWVGVLKFERNGNDENEDEVLKDKHEEGPKWCKHFSKEVPEQSNVRCGVLGKGQEGVGLLHKLPRPKQLIGLVNQSN